MHVLTRRSLVTTVYLTQDEELSSGAVIRHRTVHDSLPARASARQCDRAEGAYGSASDVVTWKFEPSLRDAGEHVDEKSGKSGKSKWQQVGRVLVTS